MTTETFIAGAPIPEETTIVWEGRKPVRHFLFALRQARSRTIRQNNLPPKSLMLFKEEHSNGFEAHDLEDLTPYVKTLLRNGGVYPKKPASSISLPLDEQCWVVLELESSINWKFATCHPAVTTKFPDTPFEYGGQEKRGFNANLRYVLSNGELEADPAKIPEDEHCRMVIFRVLYRPRRQSYGMNFVVDLYRAVINGKADQTIPIIIDPDVPDDGHEGFPSPP